MMHGLLIETGTERGLVALVEQSRVVEAIALPFGFQNSKTLLPAIAALLKKHSLSPSDLKFIGIGAGPGSYTGLRVGVAAAKGLAFACDLPLIAISTLETFRSGQEVVLIDAKIGGAYVLLESGLPQVVPLENLHIEKGTHVATPQANPLRKKWEKLYPEQELVWEEKGPDPQTMARLAWDKWNRKEYSLNGEVEILYLRKTQAEIEKNG